MTIMAKIGKPRGTLRQKLEHVAIMGFFGAMWLVPYRLRNRWVGACLRGLLGRLLGYRKRVMDNMTLIYPEMPEARKLEIADQVLDNAGRTFTENMFPAQFQAHDPEIKLHGLGLEAVLQAHKDGRPIMFYSGHFGNHEAFRAALFKHGIKVGGMVRRMANPYFDVQYKRMLHINGRGGPVFEADKHGTLAMVKSLKTGTALVLLLDLAVSHGMAVTFMGKPVFCSVTAASFALKTNALFVPYFSMRNRDGESFSVEIGRPIEHSDAETMTREATKSLEERVHADPGNWFWIHRRWKYQPPSQ
jgi:Kdo2-lipid IVA lauroyltransferase/acyltransferase